ncbi:MAG: hypothetical protein ABIX28_03545 [Vicinamibacterales bacterium]
MKGRQIKTISIPVRATALLLIDVVNDLAFESRKASSSRLRRGGPAV